MHENGEVNPAPTLRYFSGISLDGRIPRFQMMAANATSEGSPQDPILPKPLAGTYYDVWGSVKQIVTEDGFANVGSSLYLYRGQGEEVFPPNFALYIRPAIRAQESEAMNDFLNKGKFSASQTESFKLIEPLIPHTTISGSGLQFGSEYCGELVTQKPGGKPIVSNPVTKYQDALEVLVHDELVREKVTLKTHGSNVTTEHIVAFFKNTDSHEILYIVNGIRFSSSLVDDVIQLVEVAKDTNVWDPDAICESAFPYMRVIIIKDGKLQ